MIRLAEEEDVDVIGISSLATDHLLVPKLMKALKKARLEHIPVVVGGIVPDDDEKKLKKAGVRHVFHPGASREEIVSRVAELAGEARAAKDRGGAGVTTFAREWNAALALVAGGSPRILLATGHAVAGGVAPSRFAALAMHRPMERDAPAEPRLLRTRQERPLKRAAAIGR